MESEWRDKIGQRTRLKRWKKLGKLVRTGEKGLGNMCEGMRKVMKTCVKGRKRSLRMTFPIENYRTMLLCEGMVELRIPETCAASTGFSGKGSG